jgi:phosphoglycolate phosphatase-like HAD superfamily hydrolase
MKGTIIFDLEGTLVDIGGESFSRVFVKENELKQIAVEYELGIVTGATRAQLEYILSNTFLGAYFDVNNTISKDECSEAKATGKPFQTLLDRGFCAPIVIIGDSKGDELGADALNVGFVKVDTSTLIATDNFSQYLNEAKKSLA